MRATAEQLERFRALVEKETNERLEAQYCGNVGPYVAQVKIGSKFAKVDVGPTCNMSGKYMVDLETGVIYGIKGYGVVHRGHQYGTLETVDLWWWGGYVGQPRKATA
jgi:hypothetical protein